MEVAGANRRWHCGCNPRRESGVVQFWSLGVTTCRCLSQFRMLSRRFAPFRQICTSEAMFLLCICWRSLDTTPFAMQFTVSVIEQHLQTHLRLIDDWSGYSNDKRCDSGWYFDDGRFTTGYFSIEVGRSQIQVFLERARACAEFIKHELESVRENPSFGSGQKSLGSRRKKRHNHDA
jgi:hypothetical protein